MRIFEFLIVFVIAYGFYEFFKHRRLVLKQQQSQSSSSEEVDQELTALKKRVEVLEKIVTDKGYQVNQEIDDL
ncbi:hypothetical protein QWY77_04845 [Thalassotalea ponticola]|uniref:hypothetical protein n=1 Tax=Thalassotalea ponticola TaxID=1523392 RepID=UPI0025B50E8B|nr:hypothetical protein [Thalassotalea ponticola]MDN3652094.1 hypothetical protein [Thalassotalea ponticola]